MSSKSVSVIWSRNTAQRIPCFDSCQSTITWIDVKDERYTYDNGATVLFFQGIGLCVKTDTIILHDGKAAPIADLQRAGAPL